MLQSESDKVLVLVLDGVGGSSSWVTESVYEGVMEYTVSCNGLEFGV